MTFWISYDFEINGDYAGMYRWLDNYEAVECGDSFAVIPSYQYDFNFLEELKKDIQQNVNITKRTRIYIVYKNEDGNTFGRFLFGKRKKPPWTGYGDASQEPDSLY